MRAYAWAKGDGPRPVELEAWQAINAYGAAGLYGRPLGVREVRRMELGARVVRLYQSFHAAKDWLAWQSDHPKDFEFLTFAMKLYETIPNG